MVSLLQVNKVNVNMLHGRLLNVCWGFWNCILRTLVIVITTKTQTVTRSQQFNSKRLMPYPTCLEQPHQDLHIPRVPAQTHFSHSTLSTFMYSFTLSLVSFSLPCIMIPLTFFFNTTNYFSIKFKTFQELYLRSPRPVQL